MRSGRWSGGGGCASWRRCLRRRRCPRRLRCPGAGGVAPRAGVGGVSGRRSCRPRGGPAPRPVRAGPADPAAPVGGWGWGGGVGGGGPGRRRAAGIGPNATAGCPGRGPAATPTAAPPPGGRTGPAADGRGDGAARGTRATVEGKPVLPVRAEDRPLLGPQSLGQRQRQLTPSQTRRPDPAGHARPGPPTVGVGGARPAAASAAPAPWPASARTDPHRRAGCGTARTGGAARTARAGPGPAPPPAGAGTWARAACAGTGGAGWEPGTACSAAPASRRAIAPPRPPINPAVLIRIAVRTIDPINDRPDPPPRTACRIQNGIRHNMINSASTTRVRAQSEPGTARRTGRRRPRRG